MTETVADKIYTALRERIVIGELPAGEKLRQDHIARDYDASHVPVREALLRLEAHGLATSLPRRGTRVSALDPKEIREVVEMRVSLEVLALSHAVPRITDQDLGQIQTRFEACETSTDMVQWDRANRQFHMTLLSPCAMPRLLETIADLQLAAARHMFAHWRGTWRARPDPDHAALVEAVTRRETGSACDILRRHLRRVR
ncbi:GntR family transcriptional regulator [Epibacterium ulvae]|uniref:GntR family transcriptional regulator n=1 Tax=Epibacterium ulvae TaxID=1156985 RepID=UPI001BFC50CB|nr:GntR family transcriptional regulator [Epibacterium ulvae]MBT8153224.1 GntR family transcriptional regulator [Epibacterium ulvae]